MLHKMTKQLLSLLLILGFTACNERQPEVHHTTSTNVSNNTSTLITDEEVVQVETPKIVQKEKSVIPTTKPTQTYIRTPIPMLDEEVVSTEAKKFSERSTSKSQIFSGGTVTDGLDMGTIRLGLNEGTTRLVFDSYTKFPKEKAINSGHYDFKYDAKNRRITVVVSGYRSFSALNATKPRFFRTSNMVEKIYLETYLDDSGYKFTIQLNQDAQVNVFELKEPARIIVDITPM